jgi:hypothetical protein
LEAMVKSGKDTIDAKDAVRLPNAVPKGQKMTLSVDENSCTQQMISSPTNFLN